MSKDTLSKPKPFTLVMSGYAAAGNLSGVQRLWMAMKQRGVQENLVTYNVVLNCFANMRDEEKALSLLSTMEADGITADLVSYNTAIRACKRYGTIQPHRNSTLYEPHLHLLGFYQHLN